MVLAFSLLVFGRNMNKPGAVRQWAKLIFLGAALWGQNLAVLAAERNLTRTNLTERWITNLIEVRMPKNIFVDHFHTNWTSKYVTNVVEVLATNWISQKVTNTIPVEATRKVQVTEYRTNWNTVSLTNRIPVQLVRTNFVQAWQTNLRTLTLTNWETVLVMKTNWITQPVTNVVKIDLITNRPPPVETARETSTTREIPVQPLPQVSSTLSDSIQLEASRTSRPPNRNVVELMVRARWVGESDGAIHVQQWRVESDDGAILCHSQDQDFRRELPVGRYRIEVKAQKDANSPLLASRGVVDLSAASATMLPLTSAK
jgi:hypothetical protein